VLHLLVAVGVGDGRIHQSPPSTEHSEEEHKRKEMEICLFFLGGGVSFQFDKGKKMKEIKWPQKATQLPTASTEPKFQ